jgi:hypothetical protein
MGKIPNGRYPKEFREEAIQAITEYIAIFCNPQRIQKKLGSLSGGF